jgi:hypothetical protein
MWVPDTSDRVPLVPRVPAEIRPRLIGKYARYRGWYYVLPAPRR